MNRERFKTLLLVSLVLMSIYLTQQLWIELPYRFIPSLGSDSQDEVDTHMISDIISPEKYLINFGSNHTILYSEEGYDLWNKAKDVLKSTFQDKNVTLNPITPQEFTEYKSIRSMELDFAEEIPTYIFPNMLQIRDLNSVYNNINKISRIYIALNSDPFIVLSDGTSYLKVKGQAVNISEIAKTIEKIKETDYTKYYPMSQAWNVDSDVYITSNVKSLSDIYVKNEINVSNDIQIKTLASEFFSRDLDYIKKIEENNGTVIYLNNNDDGLKISADGMITYFNTVDHLVSKRNLYQSLTTAVSFIDNHMGWPEDSYLSSIEEIESDGSKGYLLRFTYRIGGKPILLKGGTIKSPIEIEVFNDQVKAYRRYIRTIDRPRLVSIEIRPILPPEQLQLSFLAENYMRENDIDEDSMDFQNLSNKILSSINDIYLAYYDPSNETAGERLISVWVLDVNGTTYMFDTYSGQVINGGIMNTK